MDVDAAFSFFGGFGVLQTLNFLVYAVVGGASAWLLTGVSFTIADPQEHRCRLPAAANGTAAGWDGGAYSAVAQQCEVVVHWGEDENETLPCEDGWEYTTTHGETTVVMDVSMLPISLLFTCLLA